MQKATHVSFNVNMPYKLTKRNKWFVCSCPILDIHTQGETERKAKKNLSEAIFLFFISCFERGTLDAALKDCGFKLEMSKVFWTTPFISTKPPKNSISVPIPFVINQGNTTRECLA